MDDMRNDVHDAFADQQAGVGDLTGARARLVRNALASNDMPRARHPERAAGIAAAVIAALVIATFAFARFGSPRPQPPPVPAATPSASVTVSPSPITSPTTVAAPSARFGAAMAYDPDRQVALLFGGVGNSGWLNDTWTWDGAVWKQLIPAQSPPPRQMAEMAWDTAQKKAVLFGGIAAGGTPLNDMWAWDGVAWTELHPAHRPSARAPVAIAYDVSGARLILYGARKTGTTSEVRDTWIWNGADWAMLTSSAPEANVATYPSIGMAWEGAAGEVTLVDWNPFWSCPTTCNGGGIRVWRLGSSGWTNPVYFQCGCEGNNNLMAYDPGRTRWLFYGAQSGVLDFGVTIFDGVNRSSPGEVSPHPAANGDDMAYTYDPDHKEILVFGGNGAGVPSAELWAWDFQHWSRLSG